MTDHSEDLYLLSPKLQAVTVITETSTQGPNVLLIALDSGHRMTVQRSDLIEATDVRYGLIKEARETGVAAGHSVMVMVQRRGAAEWRVMTGSSYAELMAKYGKRLELAGWEVKEYWGM